MMVEEAQEELLQLGGGAASLLTPGQSIYFPKAKEATFQLASELKIDCL
ncbi:hypothetical protein V8G56_03855 [Gaetbulibacter aquiaggeris]|uniref:Uncharacterized protein n=1 Tax=Gaetbulibacter aquiaggeris TaxID=1735373 RepID=A0ABW7MM14_9FLAO